MALLALNEYKKYLEDRTAGVNAIISSPALNVVQVVVSTRLTGFLQQILQYESPYTVKVVVKRMSWWQRLTCRGVKVQS